MLAAVASSLLHHAPAAGEGFTISSPAFAHEKAIPKKYTCDRANISPPLRWNGAPEGTKSFALVAEDPTVPVGSWSFWVLYDLPAGTKGVPQGVAASEPLPGGAKHGLNEFGKVGYSGPCPPPGQLHHYYFRVYALDAPTKLEPGATKAKVFRAMKHHVLRVAEVLGTFERRTQRHDAASGPPSSSR